MFIIKSYSVKVLFLVTNMFFKILTCVFLEVKCYHFNNESKVFDNDNSIYIESPLNNFLAFEPKVIFHMVNVKMNVIVCRNKLVIMSYNFLKVNHAFFFKAGCQYDY